MFVKWLMKFEIFMSWIKHYWIFQQIMYFQVLLFEKKKHENYKIFTNNIINVKDANVLQ
jgi:hypothetical protein